MTEVVNAVRQALAAISAAPERTFTKSGRSHMVRIPNENAEGFFATSDRTVYQRDEHTSTIRRAIPKVKGKAARKAERRARREAHTRLEATRDVLPPAASDVA